MSTAVKSGLLQLRVEKIVHETPDAISIIFKETEGKELTFKPGQFLTFVFDREGKEVRRSYSIFTSPSRLPEIGIAIKKVPGGYVSDTKLDDIKVGDVLAALVPMGNFIRKGDPKKNLVFFGAGSGITPLLAIIEDCLNDSYVQHITLHYANRNEKSIIFKDRLTELESASGGKLEVVHHLTQPLNGWKGSPGRIDKAKAFSLISAIPEDLRSETAFYMCGPGAMMDNICEAAQESGFAKIDLHREFFTLSIKNESRLPVEQVPRDVTVIAGGRSYDIIVQPGDSILETALDAGIDLPFSCQYGSCGSCMTKLVSGKVVMIEQTALSDEEIEKGFCLTCVGYPVSDNVIVNYDDPLLR